MIEEAERGIEHLEAYFTASDSYCSRFSLLVNVHKLFINLGNSRQADYSRFLAWAPKSTAELDLSSNFEPGQSSPKLFLHGLESFSRLSK